VLCWDIGTTKTKPDSSLVLMDGRKQGESVGNHYKQQQQYNDCILTSSEIQKYILGHPDIFCFLILLSISLFLPFFLSFFLSFFLLWRFGPFSGHAVTFARVMR
jgi:hypothetical protein